MESTHSQLSCNYYLQKNGVFNINVVESALTIVSIDRRRGDRAVNRQYIVANNP